MSVSSPGEAKLIPESWWKLSKGNRLSVSFTSIYTAAGRGQDRGLDGWDKGTKSREQMQEGQLLKRLCLLSSEK
ncbi:hypothetical protein OJAV_G00170810 [Oryzias javanicus]|uniref:Uncharacterized protein n=1 Tax=Oryzias javanicus TaxID=123683 RepID=A0A437CF38_ORYJA|nr:hypothetical protein OJAV_G00170810 [Oryzias javanicus]